MERFREILFQNGKFINKYIIIHVNYGRYVCQVALIWCMLALEVICLRHECLNIDISLFYICVCVNKPLIL